jgi:hypothetical protein
LDVRNILIKKFQPLTNSKGLELSILYGLSRGRYDPDIQPNTDPTLAPSEKQQAWMQLIPYALIPEAPFFRGLLLFGSFVNFLDSNLIVYSPPFLRSSGKTRALSIEFANQ